jgi:hypothetical protein
MRRTLPVIMLTAALTAPTVAHAASIDGTYQGSARSTDGGTAYGKATFTIKKGKLVSWAVEEVPRQCEVVEQMNYGFIVASNVLKAYGLKAKDVKLSKKNRLSFTYKQPNHLDAIKVDVKFTKKRAKGSVVNTPESGQPSATENCSGSARMTMKK